MDNDRINKFDNIKFICIILVVMGHVMEQYMYVSWVFRSIFLFIYSFHMPMFIFISGLFQKRYDQGAVFKIQRFVFLIVTGYLLKLIIYLVRLIFQDAAPMEWFGGSSIPWFMMVMALHMLFVYVIRKLKVHPVVLILASVVVALICGYFDFIGDFLWLSRFFVFLPFYLTGYYLTPQKVIEVTSKVWVRIPACILIFAAFVTAIFKGEYFFPLRSLFSGRNPYSAVPFEGCNALSRLMCYAITAILCISIISIVTNRKIPLITHMGSNTLSVFFWHRIVLYILGYTWVLYAIALLPFTAYVIGLLLLSVALGFILMLDPFQYPLDKLSDLLNRASRRVCIVILCTIVIIGIVFTCFEGIV